MLHSTKPVDVPSPKAYLMDHRTRGCTSRDDLPARFDALQVKFRELEMRLRLLESEMRGQVDLSEFGKPEILADLPDDE